MRLGLAAVRGVGDDLADTIETNRHTHGDFHDVEDLVRRVPELTLAQLEAFATAGATSVSYVRDVNGRIVARTGSVGTLRYLHSGGSDSPTALTDGSGVLLETTGGLPGGVLLMSAPGNPERWSYPDLHGSG